MKVVMFLLIAGLSFCSCQQPVEQASTVIRQKVDTIQNAVVNKQVPESTFIKFNEQQGNEIHVQFPAGSNSVRVKGRLDSTDHAITCYVPISEGNLIKGVIATMNSASNIRFNQVVLPDGKSDGPFGKELNYLITQKGTYKILIAPSPMAENPYYGDFLLRFYIK